MGAFWVPVEGRGGTSQATPCERGGGMGAAIHGGLEGGGVSIPYILLLITSQNLPIIANEIRNIMQLLLPNLLIHIRLHDRSRYYTNLVLPRQIPVFV